MNFQFFSLYLKCGVRGFKPYILATDQGNFNTKSPCAWVSLSNSVTSFIAYAVADNREVLLTNATVYYKLDRSVTLAFTPIQTYPNLAGIMF